LYDQKARRAKDKLALPVEALKEKSGTRLRKLERVSSKTKTRKENEAMEMEVEQQIIGRGASILSSRAVV
jgi:hypothetical protein